ncbi:hypothetical protein CRUP_019069, partial [Coryphaenoides rupestris]
RRYQEGEESGGRSREEIPVWRSLEESGGVKRCLEESGEVKRSLEESRGVWRSQGESGGVRYSVEGFLDKNKDLLFQDFKRLMFNSANPVLKEMWPDGRLSITEVTKRPQTAASLFKISIVALVEKLACKLSPTDKTIEFQKHFRIRHYAGDVTRRYQEGEESGGGVGRRYQSWKESGGVWRSQEVSGGVRRSQEESGGVKRSLEESRGVQEESASLRTDSSSTHSNSNP